MNSYRYLTNYIRKTITLFFLFLLFLLSQNSYSQQLSFPTAYGAGAYTTGGRGGVVVHVTNLNDKGNGSLREALEMRVPRTIVFDVSGVITLKSVLYMFTNNSNVTIAGQTAPEGGITIDGHRLMMESVDNVICRYIRFRGGITAKGLGYEGNDSFSATGNIKSHIFDHCSFSWDADETASWYSSGGNYTIDKVTVQRSFLGEGLKGSLFGGGSTVKTGSMSLHHSLYYNVTHRTPNVSGYGEAAIETINNVVWTISHRLIQSNGNLKWNHIGNYYDYGNEPINNGNVHMQGAIDENPPQIYTNGNKIVAVNNNTSRGYTPVVELNADNRKSHRYFQNGQGHVIGEKLNANYFTNKQHPLLGNPIPVQSAIDAFSSVKSDVGCNARLNGDGSVSDNRDVLDIEWLNNVKSGRYVPISNSSKWKVPPINSVKRPNNFYISNPHIPEAFFKDYVPKGKSHNDIAPSGYTWLEEYLNGVDRSNDAVSVQKVLLTPNIADLETTKSLQLTATFTPQNATNQNGAWSTDNKDIATVDGNGLVTAVSEGEVNITFTSADGGLKSSSQITVFREALYASAGSDQEICAGSSTILTATGGFSYLWNTGETTATISVTPNNTTTYSVKAYDSSGKNSDTDEVTVTVNPVPTVNAGNNITINLGESTTLTATGASTYMWSTGAKSASVTVSPTATRTYTVTGTKDGCDATDTVKVTVLNTVEVIADAGADQSICGGTSTTLTAAGGSTYLWSTGDTTAKINVTPNKTTTYTVTVYESTGKYFDTDNVTVTVNSIPEVNAGKDVTITLGESTTLIATGASTYLWNTGATNANIKVSPTATRVYKVIGTRNGCEAASTVKVTVVNPEKVVAHGGGDKEVCEGSNVTLTATGGDTYLWSTGAKTASITVSPKSTAKYSVTAFVGNLSDTDEVIVNVNPKPNVAIKNGAEAAILEGEFITLSATGAKTYNWSNGATQPNIAVRPNITRTYDVIGHVNKCSSAKSIKVNVFEKVVASAGSDVTIYRNETTVLTATGPKNSAYLWSTGETTKSITVGPNNDTEYSVMVYHDLDSDTANVMVKVMDLETEIIEGTVMLEFLIYPNPTDGELNIKISGLTNLSSIHLYDLSGKSLYNEIINQSDKQRYIKTLNLSDYASGIYLLQLVDNHRVITKKVVLR